MSPTSFKIYLHQILINSVSQNENRQLHFIYTILCKWSNVDSRGQQQNEQPEVLSNIEKPEYYRDIEGETMWNITQDDCFGSEIQKNLRQWRENNTQKTKVEM